MSRGIASLRRYQGGGRVDPPRGGPQEYPSSKLGARNTQLGLGSLVLQNPKHSLQSSAWRTLHQLSPEVVAKMTTQQKLEYMLLREFDRLAPIRDVILQAPSELHGLRNRVGSGSYQGYFPQGLSVSGIERDLVEILGPPITAEEIAQAWDDPMFGGTGRMSDLDWAGEVGKDDFTLSDKAINERIYARRYANQQIGDPDSFYRFRVGNRLLEEFEPLPEMPIAGREAPTEAQKRASAEVKSRRRTMLDAIDEIPDPKVASGSTLLPAKATNPEFERWRRSLDRASDLRRPFGGIYSLGRGLPRLGRASVETAKNLGVASLRVLRNKLPAMVAAGAATAATSNPVSALADVMMSPTQLGSGDLPGEYRDYGLYGPAPPSRLSYEDQLKYYENLQNQGALLMPLRDYFPSQFGEATMTRGYPGQQIRSRGPGR